MYEEQKVDLSVGASGVTSRTHGYIFMCDKQDTVIFLCVTSRTPLLFFMCDKQDTVIFYL